MTILASDIKLMEPERLTDQDNGGGRMTGVEVIDGEANNLFPDISRLDRTYGRVNLRKAYMSVRTNDTQTYYGSHVIVTQPPDDASVSVTIFTTNSFVDVRTDAQDRVESYVVRGPESPMYLYGNQPEGAKAFTAIQRLEVELPEVGDVLVLSVEDDQGNVSSEQYVRVADVDHEERTFVDQRGEYTRRVLTLTITSELTQKFNGAEATRFTDHGSPTLVRTTTLADAADYFGIVALNQPASANDFEVHIPSIFSQLVPTREQESGIVDAEPKGANIPVVAGPAVAENVPDTFDDDSLPVSRFLTRGFLVDGISIDRDGGSWDRVSNEDGDIVAGASDSQFNAGAVIGSVAPADALMTWSGGSRNDWFSNTTAVTYQPAAVLSKIAQSDAIEITTSNQGTVYTRSYNPPPAPGTLIVDYRALGEWYRLTDNGDGTVSGTSPNLGSGTIDYVTGSVNITLGTVPDLGSAIIFSWGYETDYKERAGEFAVETPAVEITLDNPPTRPGSVAFSWESGGVTKTATADASGDITGDATGQVHHETGRVALRPIDSAIPDSGSTIVVDYDEQPGDQGTVDGTPSGDTLSFTLPASALPVDPGGFSCRFPVTHGGVTRYLQAKDDGAGSIVVDERPPESRTDYAAGEGIAGGSIDYTTGDVSIQVASFLAWVSKQVGWRGNCPVIEWQLVTSTPSLQNPTAVLYRTREDVTGSDVTHQDSHAYPGLVFNLTPGTSEHTVGESVWFTWGGKEFFDRNGSIFRDLDHRTGAATLAGTINYSSGEVTLDNYGTSSGGPVTVRSLLTQHGTLPVGYFAHRTPGSPVRPGSYFVRANRIDTGQQISGQADSNGNVSGTYMRGVIDQTAGWAELQFGELVPAAGNENEPWYSEDNVEGSNVWKPITVDPESIRFNVVIRGSVPVDPELLGLDPVRLPADGRVPVFRPGNVVIIHETKDYTFPDNLTAGQIVSLPDSGIATFELRDQTGALVDDIHYTVDYAGGSVTMADPLDLSAYTEPLIGTYMYEDMTTAGGVDLSGRITLDSALSHDYSTDAFVSSALLYGDLQAFVPVFFDQTTWQNNWVDQLEGDEPTAEYNRTDFPLEVVNEHCIPERWALIFNSSTTFDIVGETLGQIGTGDTSSDTAPTNPNTGQPYWTLRAGGWGGGWSAGNVLRFNTLGPHVSMWITRAIQPGASTGQGDKFALQLRGDTD